MTDVEHPVPPTGEEIHLPGPTAKPFVCAIGITLAVIGTTIYPPYVSIFGLIVFLVTTVKWIMDVRHDVAALPEEHDARH